MNNKNSWRCIPQFLEKAKELVGANKYNFAIHISHFKCMTHYQYVTVMTILMLEHNSGFFN